MASHQLIRSFARRGPLMAALGFAGLVAQGYYAGHRTLPHFLDQDGSGTLGNPDGLPVRLVAIGDSALTGPGLLDMDDLWIRQALRRLPPRYRIDLQIHANGGAWAREVRRDHIGLALALRPDIAIISCGSNDAVRGVPLRTIRSHLTYMAGALAEVADTVILTGVGDMGTIPRLPQPLASALSWRSRGVQRVHNAVAAAHPRIVALAMWEEGSQPFRENPGLFTPDLFHPNADGQRAWANVAFPVLAAAFQRLHRQRSS